MKKINLFIMTLVCIFSVACSGSKSSTSEDQNLEFNRDEVWQLASMRGNPVKYAEDQDPVTIQLNPEALTVNGNSGCNTYFGDFKYSNKGTFTFGDLGCTRMACPEPMMRLEDQYLPILAKVDSYKLTAYKLTFLQGEKVLLEFDKQ